MTHAGGAELVTTAWYQCFELVLVTQITLECDGLPTKGFNFGNQVFCIGFGAFVVNGNVPTLLSQSQRNSSTDSSRSGGNEHGAMGNFG